MKSKTTTTLKLERLPNGGLELTLTGNWPMRDLPMRGESDPIILDDCEVQALKDFLNEPDPTPT